MVCVLCVGGPESKGQLDVIINSTATGFAQLSKSGKELYLGQLRGVITVFDTDSQKVLDVYRVRHFFCTIAWHRHQVEPGCRSNPGDTVTSLDCHYMSSVISVKSS